VKAGTAEVHYCMPILHLSVHWHDNTVLQIIYIRHFVNTLAMKQHRTFLILTTSSWLIHNPKSNSKESVGNIAHIWCAF